MISATQGGQTAPAPGAGAAEAFSFVALCRRNHQHADGGADVDAEHGEQQVRRRAVLE